MTKYTNLVVCVNYNNSSETMTFVKNIKMQNKAEEICIVVVENSDSEAEKENLVSMIQNSGCADIYLVQATKNLGYLNGMFYGVKYYKANISEELPKWITFCNTDIEIKDPDFFQKVATNEYDENTWCLAPAVYSTTTESYQNPHYKTRISKQKINRVINITRSGLLLGIYTRLSDMKAKEKKQVKEESQYVYAAHGSFFILKKEFLDWLNPLVYPVFLYSEEAFIAENVRLNNKTIYYDKTLDVFHYEHSTTNLLGNNRRAKYIHESLKYIRNTFYK